jgi:hypothetical protein
MNDDAIRCGDNVYVRLGTFETREKAIEVKKAWKEAGYSAIIADRTDLVTKKPVHHVYLRVQQDKTEDRPIETTFHVIWTIDVDACTPQAAALEAWKIQQRCSSTATHFQVTAPDLSETIVDFCAMGHATPDQAEFALYKEGIHGL